MVKFTNLKQNSTFLDKVAEKAKKFGKCHFFHSRGREVISRDSKGQRYAFVKRRY